MSFDNFMGYILSISMSMQHFTTIFHSVQEIGPFSLFQDLELGKASTDEKCNFAISWARYQCVHSKRRKDGMNAGCAVFSRRIVVFFIRFAASGSKILVRSFVLNATAKLSLSGSTYLFLNFHSSFAVKGTLAFLNISKDTFGLQVRMH